MSTRERKLDVLHAVVWALGKERERERVIVKASEFCGGSYAITRDEVVAALDIPLAALLD